MSNLSRHFNVKGRGIIRPHESTVLDLVAQLNHSVDANQAIDLLKTALARIPNVVTAPSPDVEILQFTAMGPVLAVRPYTNNEHYWQVYFDTNRLIRDTFGEAGFSSAGAVRFC